MERGDGIAPGRNIGDGNAQPNRTAAGNCTRYTAPASSGNVSADSLPWRATKTLPCPDRIPAISTERSAAFPSAVPPRTSADESARPSRASATDGGRCDRETWYVSFWLTAADARRRPCAGERDPSATRRASTSGTVFRESRGVLRRRLRGWRSRFANGGRNGVCTGISPASPPPPWPLRSSGRLEHGTGIRH